MKHQFLGRFVSVLLLLAAQAAHAQGINSQQIALLRWYHGNTAATFTLNDDAAHPADNPGAVAFDGQSMWISGSSRVYKLRASDGYYLGNWPVGSTPLGIAFDGKNIWVENYSTNNLSVLAARDGAHVATVPVGIHPEGIAFDGTHIWVANCDDQNGVDTNGTLMKIRAKDLVNLTPGGVYVGGCPDGLAFDGQDLWVSHWTGHSVSRVRTSDGFVLATYQLPNDPITGLPAKPNGMAFDGSNIWVADGAGRHVIKLSASNGAILGSFFVGVAPRGVVFDGQYIWIAVSGSNIVRKLRASDGFPITSYPAGGAPRAVAFDGGYVWVTGGAVPGTVSKM